MSFFYLPARGNENNYKEESNLQQSQLDTVLAQSIKLIHFVSIQPINNFISFSSKVYMFEIIHYRMIYFGL